MLLSPVMLLGTPANRLALDKYYDRFLSRELNRCTTCHLPSDKKDPQDLDEFPHNGFGQRLRALGQELGRAGQKKDIAARLARVAGEDSDGDGVDNETEILLGHNPGDRTDVPAKSELAAAHRRKDEFRKYLASYRWQPFETVHAPLPPKVKDSRWVRNPIDAFVAAERDARGLKPRPEADRQVLLRRVYLDLIGLTPTPEEQAAFQNDRSGNAYEKVVDRLLADPRYGERWGRHWMDIWRYSDWAGWSGGNQIRDSKPHIWRWRDWIVQSLNQDKGYDRMMVEMLAADELLPEDTNALPATGYLVRNFKLLSREQWLDDTIKHTSQAFLGITLGCAKCHDHMYDPISQGEYYRMRAVFEPHQVRTDRIPGELDAAKDGLVRAFDTATNDVTFLFARGDERRPDTNRVMTPGVPRALCWENSRSDLEPQSIHLPYFAAHPDKREFVIHETIAQSEKALANSRAELERARTNAAAKPDVAGPARAGELEEKELAFAAAEARHTALLAVLRAEKLEDDGGKDSEKWSEAAQETSLAQRKLSLAEKRLKVHLSRKAEEKAAADLAAATNAPVDLVAKSENAPEKPDRKRIEKLTKALESAKKEMGEAEKAFAEAEKESAKPAGTGYQPRSAESFPEVSTGRRLAFALWLADARNPLTARVAVNHLWLRHFGRGIVATPADFGRNGAPPSHPQLLDWLAGEFMAKKWSMKAVHRLIVTSSTYRMSSTSDAAGARIDPDDIWLWKFPSRRLESEVIRDNLLYVSYDLDPAMGGREIDHTLGLTSKRRSIYLRIAAEKEVEFLKVFDGPSVTECYQRRPTVLPQQALALVNSELVLAESRSLAKKLSAEASEDTAFVRGAFLKILARPPKNEELRVCLEFLQRGNGMAEAAKDGGLLAAANPSSPATGQARENRGKFARQNLILVLFNHNDFVTMR